jgi:TRAP-type uncharacterized transport system fused permease subunit
METGFEAMKIGSIIYFVPFFFLMNPALVLQGALDNFVLHFTTAVLGVSLVSCGLQGYLQGVGDLRRCGALEWPLRAALIIGGLLLVAPGGGLMPLTPLQMTGAALAILGPAVALAKWLAVRTR